MARYLYQFSSTSLEYLHGAIAGQPVQLTGDRARDYALMERRAFAVDGAREGADVIRRLQGLSGSHASEYRRHTSEDVHTNPRVDGIIDKMSECLEALCLEYESKYFGACLA